MIIIYGGKNATLDLNSTNTTCNLIVEIKNRANGRMILTTEKDFVRLAPIIQSDLLFYLGIEMKMNASDQKQLDQILMNASNKRLN